MAAAVALLRGINVGGRNLVPMPRLVRVLQSLGLTNVRSYIQSGNVVFDSPGKTAGSLGPRIAQAVEDEFGFRPQVLLVTANQLHSVLRRNPFPEAASHPRTLHCFFLASQPGALAAEQLERYKTRSERFQVVDRVLYLHAPEGIGRSKLATSAERVLGVTATARNWATVQKLAEMVRDVPPNRVGKSTGDSPR